MENKYLNKDYLDEKEEIRAFFCVAHREEAMHSHEFYELAYVYEGRGVHYTSENCRDIQEGEFVFIKPGAYHAIVSPPKDKGSLVRVLNCIFTQDYFNRILNKYNTIAGLDNYSLSSRLNSSSPVCIHLSDDNAENIRHLMWLIAHEYNHFTTGSKEVIEHTLLSLLISIVRLNDYQTHKAAPVVSKSLGIDELMKYMRSNFGSKLTLDLLAAHVHLSREYLSRYFKQYTGKTISEFLLEVRMSRAKQMLRTTTHSVADIGAYCGYPSVSNFQKSFKKFTGMSPSEYRQS